MRLNGIVGAVLDGAGAKLGGVTARLRRSAILYTTGAFCSVAAVIFAASASVLALEPHVGVVYARLILAGVFALFVLAIVLTVWLAARREIAPAVAPAALHAEARTARRSAQFAQLAMIAEAVMLGYSLARKR